MKDDNAINKINSYSILEKIGVIKISSESPTPPPPGPELLGRTVCVRGGGGGRVVTPHKEKFRKRAQVLQRGPGMLKLPNVLNIKDIPKN
jgi:hypothetical protein